MRSAAPLIVLALVACADPAAEQAKRDFDNAKLTVMADAAFYWRCSHQPVVMAGECREFSEAFERDRAAFVAKYGSGKN